MTSSSIDCVSCFFRDFNNTRQYHRLTQDVTPMVMPTLIFDMPLPISFSAVLLSKLSLK